LKGDKIAIEDALQDGIDTASSIIGDIEKVINDLDDNGKTVRNLSKTSN